MRHKPIPWAIALTGVLYFGLLIYWQSDELSSEIAAQRNAAQFGLVLSVSMLHTSCGVSTEIYQKD